MVTLATYDKLIPYLQRIDDSHYYTNFGQLNAEYEKLLSKRYDSPIVTASSGTSALIATIIALGLPDRSLIACPSWTFLATPMAILAAGHIPYFTEVPVDDVAAAIVVYPFGNPVDIKDANYPIIIDAAAGFDSVKFYPTKYPTIISTHATKVFGTGEGGFVIAGDKAFAQKIKAITNFGRESLHKGINGKLSEYHAAVGLANLAEWADKREVHLRRQKIYEIQTQYAVSTFATLNKIEGRKNVYGCHLHPSLKDFPRGKLEVTEQLMKHMAVVTI